MFKYKKTIYLGKKGMIIFGILMGIFVAVALWIFISAYSTPHTERIQICIKDIYGNIYINLNGEMHGYYPNEVPVNNKHTNFSYYMKKKISLHERYR